MAVRRGMGPWGRRELEKGRPLSSRRGRRDFGGRWQGRQIGRLVKGAARWSAMQRLLLVQKLLSVQRLSFVQAAVSSRSG